MLDIWKFAMQKISSNQIFILLLVILIGIFLTFGIYQVKAALLGPGGGGVLSPSFLTLDGDGIRPSNPLYTIGTEENPWLAGFFTTMNASTSEITNLTISGASAGNLDMGGFDITNVGNIGIGTTSPGTILSVGDTTGLNFTTGTSTFNSAGGLNINSGCFAIAGTCLIPGGTLTIGDTVTSGTVGSVLFIDGSGNLGQDNANFFWNDTDNRLGIASTTPTAQFSIEYDGTGDIFFIGDQGTSSPMIRIDGEGNMRIGSDTIFNTKIDIGIPGTAGGLDVGEGGSYTTNVGGATIVQAFLYDESAVSGSRFTEVELTDAVTWNTAVGDRIYVGSQIKMWAVRFNLTQAKSAEVLQMHYYNGTATATMDHMGFLKDAATSTGQAILEQIAEKEYVTWDRNINADWATADNIINSIPDGDANMYWVYFEVPTGGMATPPIVDEIKVRGDDVDIVTGTPFIVLWGQARVEKHERISLSVVKSPGGTGTTNIDIASGSHDLTVFDFNGVDELSFLWQLPEGIDTSSRIEATIDYSASANDTYDIELFAKKLPNNTAINATADNSFTASTSIVAAAGNTFYTEQTLMATLMSIQDIGPDDVISFKIARTDTTNSFFPMSLTIHYTAFSLGEHLKK